MTSDPLSLRKTDILNAAERFNEKLRKAMDGEPPIRATLEVRTGAGIEVVEIVTDPRPEVLYKATGGDDE